MEASHQIDVAFILIAHRSYECVPAVSLSLTLFRSVKVDANICDMKQCAVCFLFVCVRVCVFMSEPLFIDV